MVEKKKRFQKKRVVRQGSNEENTEQPVPKQSFIEKTPMSRRPKENNEGFGILKFVGFAILVLVVGSAILFNRSGGREALRGDKTAGELCSETTECQKGYICFSHQENRRQCMKTCHANSGCEAGYTCTTSAASKRKGMRVVEICVPDAKS